MAHALPTKMSVSHPLTSRGLEAVYLAALVDMGHDLLLEVAHVLLELFEDVGQVVVFPLEVFDPVLQLRDLFELLLAAFGGGHPVARPLSLKLDHFLVAHVDGDEGSAARPGLAPFATFTAFAFGGLLVVGQFLLQRASNLGQELRR